MIALIGIIIKNDEAVKTVNELLHIYRERIAGRMGLPLGERGNVISIVIDADPKEANALAGRLGSVAGVKAKVLY